MAWSTTWTVTQRLLAGLTAAPDLDGWRITYGQPLRPDDRLIWIAERADKWERGVQTSGIGADESYRLTVVVYSRRTGGLPAEVRAEIEGAGQAIADVIAADRTMGGACNYLRVAGGEYDAGVADGDGRAREGVLAVYLAVEAYGGA